jgi:hypothetical protein
MKTKFLFITLLSTITLFSCGSNDSSSNESSSGDIEETVSSSEEVQCPHCDGAGQRMNQISGQYGDCASCGGDGMVSSDNRLSK